VTVETALCLPILFLLIFALLEFSRVNEIRHSIHDAAYEAARRGLAAGATVADVQNRARSFLQASWISNASVTVAPDPITQATAQVTVTISVPLNANGWGPSRFFLNRTLTSTITLNRDVTGSY
jgi:Flp pilus assembly protein TadG